MEVTSSILWEVGSPQRGIYNGIKTYCIGQGCIGAKNSDGDTNDATKHMVLHPCANERHKQVDIEEKIFCSSDNYEIHVL